MDGSQKNSPDDDWKLWLTGFVVVMFSLAVTAMPFEWGFLTTGCAVFALLTLGIVRLVNRNGAPRRINPPPDAD